MRRWWLLPLGIVIACAALLALVRGAPDRPVASGPPLDEIDDASRERLERVLRDAERGSTRDVERGSTRDAERGSTR